MPKTYKILYEIYNQQVTENANYDNQELTDDEEWDYLNYKVSLTCERVSAALKDFARGHNITFKEVPFANWSELLDKVNSQVFKSELSGEDYITWCIVDLIKSYCNKHDVDTDESYEIFSTLSNLLKSKHEYILVTKTPFCIEILKELNEFFLLHNKEQEKLNKIKQDLTGQIGFDAS
jgi:hypothetical protein